MHTYRQNEDLSVITPDKRTLPKSEEFGDSESGRFWQEMRDHIADGDGELIAYTVSDETKIDMIVGRVEGHVTTNAKINGYSGQLAEKLLPRYAMLAVGEKYRAQGIAFTDWCDQVWYKTLELIDTWQAGGAELTPDEVIAALPDLVLP